MACRQGRFPDTTAAGHLVQPHRAVLAAGGQDICIGANTSPWTITPGRDNTVSSLRAPSGRVCPI
ncbi:MULTISPECIES: hypothetical protein [unclassified Streptomyces]|uniref:hypothetical protein n=1 Tax=unclassified Streptomyces TaxID=2593676 RepID=UPI0033FBD7F0